MIDPYTCPTCRQPWPVRVLAAECCTRERAERLRKTKP
jgi:hypothetical protein